MHGSLTPRQKAAVIVRLLAEDEGLAGLDQLDGETQSLLAEEMAGMNLIDRQTRDNVVSEFCDQLESVGIVFPGDLDGTLQMLEGKLSADTADRLQRLSAMMGRSDPWVRIAKLPKETLLLLANNEAPELVAAMLSKLPVSLASEVFSGLERERARIIAQTVALAGEQGPQSMKRIGQVLLQAADTLPDTSKTPKISGHMGEMLNFASADLREEVLDVLRDEDEDFAESVRRAIFIFAHIPDRIAAKDVARVVREVDQSVLIRALSGTAEEDVRAADFILSGLSQRLAGTLREEIETQGKVSQKQVEKAGAEIIAVIRRLVSEDELKLISTDDDEEEE